MVASISTASTPHAHVATYSSWVIPPRRITFGHEAAIDYFVPTHPTHTFFLLLLLLLCFEVHISTCPHKCCVRSTNSIHADVRLFGWRHTLTIEGKVGPDLQLTHCYYQVTHTSFR